MRHEVISAAEGADLVIYVNRRGTARVGRYPGQDLADEARAVAALLAAAEVPFECGSEMPAAPARCGVKITFTPRRVEMTEAGPRDHRDGYLGRRALRIADAFDVMVQQAANRHQGEVVKAEKAWRKAGAVGTFRAPAFIPPFSVGQVEVAREYAALVERCASSGLKCSSLEALKVAASRGGDREVAMLRDFARLRVLQRRIGDGLAKEVRRIRPGDTKRRAIRTRDLVDRVCLGGQSLVEVLKGNGWADDQGARDALRVALCAALDRMRGFDLDHPQHIA